MFKISQLPFFFNSHSDNQNGGFEHVLPFRLYYDHELAMFRQECTPELANILDNVYKHGSLVEGSISSESGKSYVDKVVDYLFSNFDFQQDSKVLEIGYGSGVILRELKLKGIVDLTGIEPGKHKEVAGLEGVSLIHDFFPSKYINDKYDLIFTLLVLEHIEDPVSYLQKIVNSLTTNGKVIFAVPNCEPYLGEGDLSIFIHEHFSYFTKESILKTVQLIGAYVEDISIIEGAFIVTVSKEKSPQSFNYVNISPNNFYNKVSLHIESLRQLFAKYSNHELAVFAPTRAINSLYLTGKVGLRLIDDNSELHGKYLPSLISPVESFEQMARSAPKCLLIFSRTFGDRIKAKCVSDSRLINTLILTINDLSD